MTNAYFPLDEDEESNLDPQAEWLEQQYFGDCENTCVETRRDTLDRLHGMAERLEEQSFDRCDAPQCFANYELDVCSEVHMDDLHGTGPRFALDLVQTNLSQKIRFKIWTVYEVGMKYEHLKRERVLHNDKTETTHKPKYLRVVSHSMGVTRCKPAPST